jgi:hypothetical protein
MTSRAQNSKKKNDAWATESSFDQSISLEELIALPPFRQASDDSGDSYTAAARIPNWMRRRMQKLVETPGSPYQLLGDVARDMMFIGLHVLLMRYKCTNDLAKESKMASVIDMATANRNVTKRLHDFVTSVEEIADEGDIKKAMKFIEQYIGALSELNDRWYKRKAIDMIYGSEKLNKLIKESMPQIDKFILEFYDENEEDEDSEDEEL